VSEPCEPERELRKRFHQELDEINARVIRLFALVTEGVAAASESLPQICINRRGSFPQTAPIRGVSSCPHENRRFARWSRALSGC
jgi:hypothetical protein